MNKDEIFKDKSILIFSLIFIILMIINILYASFVQRGIVFDASIYFVRLLDAFSNNEWLYTLVSRPRSHIIYLWQFPVNVAYHIFSIQSKYLLGAIFSLPLFAFPAIVTFSNYLLAKRSKRWDLFLISLAIFVLFSLPASMYSVVEVLLAAPIFFLLFHYTVAEIDYKIFDILIISFLIAVSCCSSEVVMYSSIILLFSAIYYATKTENIKNKLVKYFIALNSIIMPICYLNFYRNISPDFMEDSRVLFEIKKLKDFFLGCTTKIDYLFLIFIVLIIILYRNRFFAKHIKKLIYICFSILFFMLINDYSYSNDFFSRRILFFGIFPLAMLIGLMIDIFKEKIGVEKLNDIVKKSLFLTLIVGIINTIFQIQCSYLFNNTIDELNNITEKNNETFIVPSKDMDDFYNKPFCDICFNCDTYSFDSISFNKNYKIDKVVIYDKTNPLCPHEFYFQDGKLNLPFATTVNIKNKFWDMSPLEEKLKKDKMLKNKIEDKTDTTSSDPNEQYEYILNSD